MATACQLIADVAGEAVFPLVCRRWSSAQAYLVCSSVWWNCISAMEYLWMPRDLGSLISGRTYFNILFVLTAVWAVTVCIGFFKCGWPALLLLTYAKWGLFAAYFWVSVYWACLRGDCI
jgi:hypothetical protein